jgi:hypothetical protein
VHLAGCPDRAESLAPPQPHGPGVPRPDLGSPTSASPANSFDATRTPILGRRSTSTSPSSPTSLTASTTATSASNKAWRTSARHPDCPAATTGHVPASHTCTLSSTTNSHVAYAEILPDSGACKNERRRTDPRQRQDRPLPPHNLTALAQRRPAQLALLHSITTEPTPRSEANHRSPG